MPTSIDSIEVKIDGQTAEAWDGILAQFDDASIYQTWAYGAVRWGCNNLSHLILQRGDSILAAAQLRIVRVPFLPGGIAYVRWGPICKRKNSKFDPEILAKMLSSLQEEYCHRRKYTLRIIPNAWDNDSRGRAFLTAFQQAGLKPDPVARVYRTVLVDLDPSPNLIRKRLNQKWRNQLNRSEKNGLTLQVSDSLSAYHEFLKLYDVMWERKRFETTVNVEEFGKIQENLPAGYKMHTFIAYKDGKPVAALVVSLYGDSCIYILGATNDQARELKASYFLHWQVILWLKEHCARVYDLGGVNPQINPGGYHFKSGFGGTEFARLNTYSCSSDLFGRGWAILAGWKHR